MDNGPSVAGCEWGFGKKLKTDSCLIVGSGLMMGGVNLMAVIIGKQPGMYVFEDDHAALYEGDTVDSKKLWEGTVELEETQCRPGSVVAQRYHASNGLTVCIYR
jgi:hypothetical protein